MTFLLLILVLAAVAGALRMVVRDDRPRIAPPASHHTDVDLLPPSARLTR